jgi:hypothetical protein
MLRNEYGVWGGSTRQQRIQARRRLADGQPVPMVLVELLDENLASEPIGDAAGFEAAA